MTDCSRIDLAKHTSADYPMNPTPGSHIRDIAGFSLSIVIFIFESTKNPKVSTPAFTSYHGLMQPTRHEFIQLPEGENAITADFHSTRTKTESSPVHITSGFYKIEAGWQRPADYTYEETKYVLAGQIDVLDEATGITHHLVPGDFAFFYVGSKVKFSTKSHGLAFYAVTRPLRTPHVNLLGRDEGKSRL
ncbi:hypothetical protein BJX63DRAFT_434215 [Aspergillus granulosus]|uniref:(S)-ureidoglycine aminohydrolase cupin domain-containing protein n=1 Tax=Aspergillus granulosus TaxID=176169 RepID=A0ABR4H5P5_9EURO